MSKTAKKPAKSSLSARPAKPAQQSADGMKTKKANKTDTRSKQARVIAMLQSPIGTTIAAIMKATGWQQHSVRGFLAGVVRKRLKLSLASKKVNGNRIYQVAIGDSGNAGQLA